jgi:hypothetical protein
MTPHWIDAPEWAQWLAQDADGIWHWFDEKPMQVIGVNKWGTWHGCPDASERWARKTPCYRDWTKTLEARP